MLDFLRLIASKVIQLLQFQSLWAIHTNVQPETSSSKGSSSSLSPQHFQIQETLCAIDLQSAKVKMTGLSREFSNTDPPMSGSSDATNLSSGGTGGTLTQTTHCSSTQLLMSRQTFGLALPLRKAASAGMLRGWTVKNPKTFWIKFFFVKIKQ